MKMTKLFHAVVIVGTGFGASLSACEDKPEEAGTNTRADAGAAQTPSPKAPKSGGAAPSDEGMTGSPPVNPNPNPPVMTPFPGWASGTP